MLWVLVAACRTAAPAPAGESTHQGVRFVHRFVADAGSSAPLVVCMHGRGGSPENLAPLWEGFARPVEVALPQGLEPFGSGSAWFNVKSNAPDEQLTAGIAAAEEKLWPAIVEVARGRPVIVTGFSQGGMMSFAIAARHPSAVTVAVPMGGMLPHGLFPKAGAQTAKVLALHGAEDDVIPLSYARDTVAAFGSNATLRVFDGAAHRITPEMQRELWAAVDSALGAR